MGKKKQVTRKNYARKKASAAEIREWMFSLERLGTRITERDLAKEFDMSPGVVRERVAELRGGGLLEGSIQSLGVVVTSLSLPETVALINATCFLECSMMLSILKRPEDLSTLQIRLVACHQELAELVPKGRKITKTSLQKWIWLSMAFHDLIAKFSDFGLVQQQLRNLYYLWRPAAESMFATPEDCRELLKEYELYLKALTLPINQKKVANAVYGHYQASLERYVRGPYHLQLAPNEMVTPEIVSLRTR